MIAKSVESFFMVFYDLVYIYTIVKSSNEMLNGVQIDVKFFKCTAAGE
jgi:hypothetical protein